MNHNQQNDEVLRLFGLASYYAHCIEEELWIARLFLLRTSNSAISHDMELVENQKITMGKLLRLVSNSFELKSAELEKLEICLEKRNWLAHKYWAERAHLLATADGCNRALAELSDLCRILQSGNNIAKEVSIRIRASIGVSEDLVYDLQSEYMERLVRGENHEAILSDLELKLRDL